MGSLYRVHPQEECFTTLLRELPEAERRNEMRLTHLCCMDECIDTLEKATVFRTLDAGSYYWYILIDESDRNQTAFNFHRGFS